MAEDLNIHNQNPAVSDNDIEPEQLNEEDEESDQLPFPNARVVKIIREALKNEHQIKKDVKLAANVLLSDILTDISNSMDQEPYNTLSIEHFNKAARKYKEIGLNQKKIRRIKKLLEKQRAELDEVVAEIELDMPDMPAMSPGSKVATTQSS